jgi:hypothetical protein
MRLVAAICLCLSVCHAAWARDKSHPSPDSAPVTVPASIDHNRVVIDVGIPLKDGSTQNVHAWVDNGDPDLWMSKRVAELMGVGVSCEAQTCTGHVNPQLPAPGILIGGMKISLPPQIPIKIPANSDAAGVIAPGMNVELNIPSTVLRQYDVLIDFPEHKFTIGAPGSIQFHGEPAKVAIDTENGLIQVPSRIENKKYNMALDVGSCISFLSPDLFDKLAAAHPDWPHMTGAVGSANMWGAEEETKWKVMRLDRLQHGPTFLTNVTIVEESKETAEFFVKRAGIPTAGLLGASALQNFRVGLDYAHSAVYFEVGRTSTFPDFDVVGVILRPENSGGFTILGVADIDGKPSVPVGPDGIQPGDSLVAVNDIPVLRSTLGQVWAMLGGMPGQERRLTIRRGDKELIVTAQVQHFLGEAPEEKEKKEKKKKRK